MPSEWSSFVESAGTDLGFTTKTPGITEIVHGWQQERRDLTAKLNYKTRSAVELRHAAGARADADKRLKYDRSELAKKYILTAQFLFQNSKTKLHVLANLKSCQISTSLEFVPPSNKKAKASIRWIAELLSNSTLRDAVISFDWKGHRSDNTLTLDEFLKSPEECAIGQKDAPKAIRIITESQNVRRFKSRKKYIEDLEYAVTNCGVIAVKFGIA